jgi:hypothetical protein
MGGGRTFHPLLLLSSFFTATTHWPEISQSKTLMCFYFAMFFFCFIFFSSCRMSSVHKLTDSEESDSSEIPLDSLKKRKRLEDDEKSSLVENEGKIKH